MDSPDRGAPAEDAYRLAQRTARKTAAPEILTPGRSYVRMAGVAAEDEHYSIVPDGKAAIWATLQRMAELVRDHDPRVTAFAQRLVEMIQELDPGLTHAEIASVMFNWVRDHMFYTDDVSVDPINAPGWIITDVIKQPQVILDEILAKGHAAGDCDDYVIFLGALYYDVGYGVTLVNVVQRGTEQEHVYLRVATPDGVYAADGIVAEDFGWELPEEDKLSEAVLPV